MPRMPIMCMMNCRLPATDEFDALFRFFLAFLSWGLSISVGFV